jgi:transcription elongation GreA/GreB family factor
MPPKADRRCSDLSIAKAARRLERLRGVLAGAEVVDDPGRAVIGRRVTVRENDATEETYGLVAPGDGDPGQGWISADSPLGTVVLDRRAGDTVEIPAPGGRRQVTVVRVG